MTALLKFTVLDDTTHVIGPSEYTVCGEVIPFGSGWSNDQPKKLCSACKSRIKDTDEFGVLRSDAEPEPEPLVDEPVKVTKDTAPSATTKATKSGNKA